MAAVLLAVLAVGIAVAGPSGAHGDDKADWRAKGAGAAVTATDARWAAMMIPHHLDGIELAQRAQEKAVTPGVREVAAQSEADQRAELPYLRKVAAARGLQPIPPEEPLMRFNEQQMATLEALTGTAFDRYWLDVFSAHHMSAIMMTDVAMAAPKNGLVRRLEHRIHSGQLRQVDAMNDLRVRVPVPAQ
jgi:uncharacterized protein (DUF305 family)